MQINETNRLAVMNLRALGFDMPSIRKAMHRLTGVTQPDMARMLNTSRQNITAHIKGYGANPDTRTAIAEIWGVPVDVLFEDVLPSAA